MSRSRLGALCAALVLVLFAGACGQSSPQQSGQRVAVSSALGTAQVPVNPKRVVTIGWGSQDAAVALGVVPVGMPNYKDDSGTADGILPWDKPLLHGNTPTLLDNTSGNIPFEDIAKLHPDVILAVYSGLNAQQYKTLSGIAPTVGYPDKPWATSWQDQLSIVGKALGRSAKAEQLKTSTESAISSAAKQHPEFRGKTIAFGSELKPGSFNLYHTNDPRVQLLKSLGFTEDQTVTKLPAVDGSTAFSTVLSAEKLPSISADVLVAWYPSEGVRKTSEAQPLFTKIPAVARKAYVPLTDPPFVFATSTANVLSLPWMLDRYLPQLSNAAKTQ